MRTFLRLDGFQCGSQRRARLGDPPRVGRLARVPRASRFPLHQRARRGQGLAGERDGRDATRERRLTPGPGTARVAPRRAEDRLPAKVYRTGTLSPPRTLILLRFRLRNHHCESTEHDCLYDQAAEQAEERPPKAGERVDPDTDSFA